MTNHTSPSTEPHGRIRDGIDSAKDAASSAYETTRTKASEAAASAIGAAMSQATASTQANAAASSAIDAATSASAASTRRRYAA